MSLFLLLYILVNCYFKLMMKAFPVYYNKSIGTLYLMKFPKLTQVVHKYVVKIQDKKVFCSIILSELFFKSIKFIKNCDQQLFGVF